MAGSDDKNTVISFSSGSRVRETLLSTTVSPSDRRVASMVEGCWNICEFETVLIQIRYIRLPPHRPRVPYNRTSFPPTKASNRVYNADVACSLARLAILGCLAKKVHVRVECDDFLELVYPVQLGLCSAPRSSESLCGYF